MGEAKTYTTTRRDFTRNLGKVLGALTITGGLAAVSQAKPVMVLNSDHPLFPAVAEWKAKLALRREAFAAWRENKHLQYEDFDNNPYRNAMIDADAVEMEAWQAVRQILIDL